MLFRGSGVALVTPFKDNEINYAKLEELLEWHIEKGTDAIIICGTTGEAATLSEDEKKKAIAFCVEKVRGRIPVFAGTGCNDTEKSISLSLYAQQVGADGVLLVTPYYNKTTQRGIIAHFTAIADRLSIPIILYNVPGRTGLNMLPDTVWKLADHPNIRAVKEASGDISQVAEIIRLCGDDFLLYSGNDDQTVPMLSLGACGVISVVANILPEQVHRMVNLFLDGNLKEARKMQLGMNKLNHSLFLETSPSPVKTAMNLLGMEVGDVRLPLVAMEPKNREILKADMVEYGLKIKEECGC